MKQTTYDKIAKYKNDFFERFVIAGDPNTAGTNIPLARINGKVGIVEDGTINIAHYLQYLYFSSSYTKIDWCLDTLERLSKAASKVSNTFPYTSVEGFFLRDDIESFPNLNQVVGCISELKGATCDPCFSPFTSQDQVWNLLPILKLLSKTNSQAYRLIVNYIKFIVDNNYTIYNPYYSWNLHKWTYYDLKIPYNQRYIDLLDNFKYNIKVTRGANCWYYGGGFVNVYNSISESKLKETWHRLFYSAFTWLADNIYHPYICKWFNLPVKNNAYYCLNVASGNKKFMKKVIEKFKQNLDDVLAGKAELNEDYAWLVLIAAEELNDYSFTNKLEEFLDNYEVPEDESPLLYLTLASLW